MTSIPLSANVRQTLYALKNLQNLTAQTSLRLNTGKKINSVTDDMPAYIKSTTLSTRAAEINKLLDTAQQSIQMIKVAQEGLTQISSFLENAKSMANLALGTNAEISILQGTVAFNSTDQVITNIPNINPGDSFVIKTGSINTAETNKGNFSPNQTINELGIDTGEPLYIRVGNEEWKEIIPSSPNMTLQQYIDSIEKNIGKDKISAEIKNGEIIISAKNGDTILIQDNPFNIPENPNVASTLGFDTGNLINITDGMSIKDLINEITKIDGINVNFTSDNKLKITDEFGRNILISDLQGQSAQTLGIKGSALNGRETNKTYADAFNDNIEQINSIVMDCYYGGINLLEGDSYTSYFDEKRQNSFTINGINANSEALGLTKAENNWENKEDIEKSLAQLEQALSQINYTSEIYAHNFNTVTASTDYMQNLKETIVFASDTIVAANNEEEAAKLLALDIMQNMCINALSLSSQSTNSILKIFG